MGVTGLWRLIEPSGKPVPLETLENKVLAVDVSIWLHQAIKGFQDSQGAPLPNAHLLGIYHRVCKLLYFRIKPVFVFDGGVPNLKKETISKRNQRRSRKLTEAEHIQKQLLTTLLKHSAVNKVLSEKTKAALITKAGSSKSTTKEKHEDIYKLPPSALDSTLSSSEDESTNESSTSTSSAKQWDLHTIDEKSPYFKALPVDVRHEILTDLKETRKQSSWGKIHEMPKQSDDFSTFQMKRLLKRYSVQISLEEVEKEMGGRSLSLSELEKLLKDQGVVTSSNSIGSRIASDEHTRFVLIKDVQKAIEEAKQMDSIEKGHSKTNEEKEELDVIKEDSIQTTNNGDLEFQRDLEKAIQLSLQDVPSTSKEDNISIKPSTSKDDNITSKPNLPSTSKEDITIIPNLPSTSKEDSINAKQKKKLNFSFLEGFNEADFQSSSESEGEEARQKDLNVLSTAKSYMIEYSGLTPNEIAKIIENNLGLSKNNKNKISEVSSSSKTCQIEVATHATDQESEALEDNIISSSTVSSSIENKTETKLSSDNNEVSSSTSVKLTNNINTSEVETMSDEVNSDSSDEFLEVTEKQNEVKESKQFEIVIKPDDTLKDDIFSDIFSKDIEDANNSKNEPEVVSSTDDVAETEDVPKNLQKQEDEVIPTKPASEEQRRNIVAEFAATTNSKSTNENELLTTEQLQEIQENLLQEKEELISERLSKERMANNLTDQIYQETQELLQLFGVPYIVAPMEAEAQCAFLDDIDLTDGTITDDSDIWLFGGKTVYKNFFNQHKHVMEFRTENIQHHFKLAREQMILLALLVGSDYTIGLQGIGPVTALEILAAFPPLKQTEVKLTTQQLISGLESFRNWLSGARAVGPGRTTLRNKLKNVMFTESFPSLQVVKAYLEPTIDPSREKFSWAKPDIPGLLAFAKKKFGWSHVKSEEILKPVLKRLTELHIQKSIKDYFLTKHKIVSDETENKMSKRVKRAVNKIGKEKSTNSEDDEDKADLKKMKKPKRKCATKSQKTTKKNENETNDAAGLSSDEDVKILKQARVQSKKKIEQINKEVKSTIEQQQAKKPRTIAEIHKKDVIPQKEKDKVNVLRSRMKAIEVLRKSKKGPGYVQKRKVVPRKPKEDAELSESSSD